MIKKKKKPEIHNWGEIPQFWILLINTMISKNNVWAKENVSVGLILLAGVSLEP